MLRRRILQTTWRTSIALSLTLLALLSLLGCGEDPISCTSEDVSPFLFTIRVAEASTGSIICDAETKVEADPTDEGPAFTLRPFEVETASATAESCVYVTPTGVRESTAPHIVVVSHPEYEERPGRDVVPMEGPCGWVPQIVTVHMTRR